MIGLYECRFSALMLRHLQVIYPWVQGVYVPVEQLQWKVKDFVMRKYMGKRTLCGGRGVVAVGVSSCLGTVCGDAIKFYHRQNAADMMSKFNLIVILIHLVPFFDYCVNLSVTFVLNL